MAKGEIIVEGAKSFCSNSVEKNSKATAVSIAVKSQTKNLGKNKYFAQEKPIATNLDNKAESFNNGEGFGECYTTDKKKLPCKAKCNIKYKDYYENVDFDKSMKVLLDISTGTCPGYGLPGIIEFATTGQKKAVNTIDVKEADDFTVENTSAQWETYNPAKEDSVSEINIIAPFAEKPTGKYYFIERAVNSGFFPLSKLIIETKLHLKAISKGDPSKITWAIFKGEGVTDKVKTFVGIGANIEFTLDKLFKDFDEGVYRIEAYARKAGSEKCFILIEYIKDYVEGITAPGKKLVKNIPIPLTLKFKASSFAEKLKILNPPTTGTETLPNAHWRVTQENRAPLQNIVIYNSQMNPDSNLVKVEIQTGLLGVFIFRNPGIYEIEAYTTPDDPSPVKTTLTVVESLEINTVKGTSSQLLRYNESLKVEVSKFNVDFLPTNTTKMQWHLQKDGVRLTVFENAAISKEKSISKPINEILYYDARGGNNYFGKYVIEAYAKLNNKPLFNGADSFFFEVIRNAADKVTLPESIPKGAKVKYEVSARIMPLTGDEKINLELPTGVTDNHDQTLTFDTEGTFEIAAYLTGDETLQTKVKAKIKVANPELKRALWAYGTGYRRTETGYNEETHAFVEIAGLENQTITIKIWVKGAGGSFYSEPAKYMLEEKKITLNDKGIGSFKISTDDKYKEKIKKALPATSETPNPNINLTFTIEPPTGNQGAIILPATMAIKNGKPVAGTKFIEVLNPNEELALTSNKVVKSIFFAKEDSKGVQQTITHQNKTHKIWVHTANMQEEEVRVDVMTLVHSDCMEEKNGIIAALQSIQEYKEKVGSDGLLELPFTAEEKYLTDAETNPVRFSIQVSRKVKDPNDDKKEIYIFEDDQLAPMSYPNASIVRSPDMKTIGIKTKKQDDTPFIKEEKIALRKQLICFKNTALIVQKGILTQEAIENCTVPVVVDLEMAEVQANNHVCECESYNLYYGKKVNCDFRKKVMTICESLWPVNYKEMANGLMAVMHRETSKSLAAHQLEGYKSLIPREKMTKDIFSKVNPSTRELSSRAIGLIQFTQSALVQMGEFTNGSGFDALHTIKLNYANMTEVDQLDKVKKYMQSVKALPKVPEDIYIAVFAPDFVGQREATMYRKGTNDYVSNASLDKDDNGIQIKELLSEFNKSLLEGIAYNKYKCENSTGGNNGNSDKWHDPVENPMLCLYTQNGNYRPRYNVFGKVRKEREKINHQGIDLLALPGDSVYACVDSFIEFIETQNGYGKVVCLRVKDKEAFVKRKKDYKLIYEDEGEILQGEGFNLDGNIYMFYAHLQSISISMNDKEVTCGKEIGLAGTSGYGTTKDPHLHFEIRNARSASGLNNRCHPGVFISYKDEANMSKQEKDEQKKISEKYWD